MDCRCWQDEGAGVIELCPCLGKVHKDILLWGKSCPMPLGPLLTPLVDRLQRSAVILSLFAKGQGVSIAYKTCPRG
jgi:hypothetical protein